MFDFKGVTHIIENPKGHAPGYNYTSATRDTTRVHSDTGQEDIMTPRKRIYVGRKIGGGSEAFRCAIEPTRQTHGDRYWAVIGPFQTARGAQFMVRYGGSNPHVQCVADAERLARVK